MANTKTKKATTAKATTPTREEVISIVPHVEGSAHMTPTDAANRAYALASAVHELFDGLEAPYDNGSEEA